MQGNARGWGQGTELRTCGRCKGKRCPDLPKHACPNAITLKEVRLQKLIEDKTKCMFWVRKLAGGTKVERGGQGHTWEDHLKAKKQYKQSSGSSGVDKGGGRGRK